MKKNRIYIILFIVLAVAAVALYLNKSNSTIKQELRDFAVKDTAAVDKIFMADRKGGTVTLERKSASKWMLNNKMDARQDGINALLTAVAGMEVKSPVGKNLYNNTMKLLASNAVKVELYSKGDLIKTFYVGHPTMDNLGTFMYLEGSSVPFIMHIPGFNGYLTPRFFTEENSWRRRIIFEYSPAFIKSVQITDVVYPDSSVTIQVQNDSTFTVTSGSGNAVHPLSREKVVSYLLGLRSVGYTSIDETMKKEYSDSLLKTGPFKKLVISSVDGSIKEASLFRRPLMQNSINQTDAKGNKLPFDIDNLFLRLKDDDNWYLCQYYTFDRLLKTPGHFKASGSIAK